MLKNIYLSLFIATLSLSSIGQCVIDNSVTTTGIYPSVLPQGTVGQPYATDVTFFMPLDTLGYNFTNFKILSASLPVGLTWQCNNFATGCNYNPQVSQYGCVHISGTPLLAGLYNVEVSVVADLTVIQGYPVSFFVTLEILPNNVGTTNDGFSMANAVGCSPLIVGFTNNNPGLASYNWNFGNGNTSTAETPGSQVYSTPGDYVVSYEAYTSLAVTNVYTLTSVTINSMSNYGGGFPTFESPDPYFILKENGSAIYQSPIILNTSLPANWTVSINLNAGSTYSLEIWEADQSTGLTIEQAFGADDYMGATTLSLNGCNGCTAGTSSTSYVVDHLVINPSPSVISVDTVHVGGFPAVPVIAYDNSAYEVSTADLGLSYQWYLNGTLIPGATGATHPVTASGNYTVLAINATGCSVTSTSLDLLYCTPSILPVISSAQGFLFVTGFPANYTLSWERNGLAVNGATNDTLVTNVPGTYAVVITSPDGCVYTTPTFSANLGVAENTFLDWNVFPNPANNNITVTLSSDQQLEEVQLIDVTGRVVKQWNWENGSQMTMDIQEIPTGYFILKLVNGSRYWTKKLIVN